MFSVKTFTIGLALAGAAFAGAAQAGVVVSSSGPSAAQFPAGKKLDDNSSITLRDGDTVTVLTSAGTRVIKGVGVHRVAATGESKRSTFAVLTRQRSAQRVRAGAVRGTGTPAAAERSPNLWYVDVSRSGAMCVASPDAVRLWRPGGDAPATYTVGGAGDAPAVEMAFDKDARDLAWDAARLPLTDGSTYSISAPGGASTAEIRFVMLDAVPEEPEDLAATLIDKGCTNQLELLTAALS
ncbi:MAG: hypothetical protein ACK4GD_09790 [Sphingomonadaceae bacterium]